MRSRIVFFLLLLVLLFVLLARNNHTVQDAILDGVTVIKQQHHRLMRAIRDRGETYIFQKETIKKLTRENKVLRQYLLDQTHYLQQVSALYDAMPSLEKLPYRSIEVVSAVSYTRLNSFDEVQLTRPKNTALDSKRIYGLIQNDVVGGTAALRGDHLFGYLTSSPRCRFGVFIGTSRSPGIAEGLDKNTMVIRFIPKWSKIDVGDTVETSGLDGIFFAKVPVGRVKEVKIEDSYKTAYVETYSDTLHPEYFFLVTEPNPYLVKHYDRNTTHFDTHRAPENNQSADTIRSIPETIQTTDDEIDPSLFEIPKEKETVKKAPKPPVVLKHRPLKKKEKTTPKPDAQSAQKPSASDTTNKPTEPPATKEPPRKRLSPMDILNGRGL